MHIVIVGAGYSGFTAAQRLEKLLGQTEAEVTLIDPHPYMTYQPFLPEVVAGSIEPRHAAISLHAHLRRTKIITGTVTGISHDRKVVSVTAEGGATLSVPYDLIAVTAGAITRTFGLPGVGEHAVGFRNVDEAVVIRDRLVAAFDQASLLPRGAERSRLLTVTFVGGGLSGVEGFGELLSLATTLVKEYTGLTFSELKFHIVEGEPRLLPEVGDRPGAWVVESLRRRGALVHLRTHVVSVEGGIVALSTGETFPSGLIVWTTGNAPTSVISRHTDLPLDDRGRVTVGADLRVITDTGLVHGAWAAGDVAAVPDLASPVPGATTMPNAQHAVRQGKLLAANIASSIRGGSTRPYLHHSLGVIATLGFGHGVFQYRSVVVKGLLAWLMHRGYHVIAIPTMERKVRVLLVWLTQILGRDTLAMPFVRPSHSAFVG